ncbi:hypothetical protein U1Q18_033277 [Sarracenia purpurea var. burkii]
MSVFKRSREDVEVEALAMANCLMLLSRVGKDAAAGGGGGGGRVFTCKTCNREFPSFQALGGHRASHKKPRLMAADGQFLHVQTPSSPAKPKTHECSICGLEFAIGQALGGHMRRHRAAVSDGSGSSTTSISQSSQVAPPVVRNLSGGGKRALCLDLNLTPYENDVKLGKMPAWLIA